MDIQLPEGVTQSQLSQFLQYLKNKPATEPQIDKNCHNCYHNQLKVCISLDCVNLVKDHKMPSHWLPQEK